MSLIRTAERVKDTLLGIINPTMERKTALLLASIFLFAIIRSVFALQDAYVTIDAMNAGVCLSADGPSNYACNRTQMIALDGTQDHMLYFLPGAELANNATAVEQMNYFLYEPLVFVLGSFSIIFAVFVGISLVYLTISAAGVKLW